MKTFKHNGALGDIIYSLPTIIALGGGVLYIGKHPSGSDCKVLSDEMISNIIELLKTQPYLSDVRRYDGEDIDYDLSRFAENFSNFDHLVNLHLKLFGARFDTSRPWLFNIKPEYVSDIIVNNGFRYRDIPLDWSVLKGYENKCRFVGFKDDHERFVEEFGLNIRHHQTKDILELASVIKGCKLFIGNQSFAFSLAEAMKVPRILEIHHHCPNCMPLSENARIVLTEKILRKTFSIKKSASKHLGSILDPLLELVLSLRPASLSSASRH